MIELVNTSPTVDVPIAEYKRLLGYPRDRALRGRARALARWAAAWYAEHGHAWTYARAADRLELAPDGVAFDGINFTSGQLQRTLGEAQAHGVIIAAVSAGPEIEEAAQIAWRDGKPDEYFFLEMYGSAVVEHLVTMLGAELCAWAEARGMAVLPHYSPGYGDWDVAQQPRLMQWIAAVGSRLPGRLEVLDSGMLRPKKSLLAVFGVTRHVEHFERLAELVPCERCSFASCQYRRRPYARAVSASRAKIAALKAGEAKPAAANTPLDIDAAYAVNSKALARWSAERLRLSTRADGTIDARFRYDGTTCTNMGRPLAFDYRVRLSPRHERFVILEQECRPAPDDQGHQHMCRYLTDARALMAAIDEERPLLGQPLNDVLTWKPLAGTAGCYCESVDRAHKWRLVLETIHYALVEREKQRPVGVAEGAAR